MEKDREKKALKNIVGNYKSMEKSIVEQLYMENKIHGTTVGTMREEVWKSFFESIIPKKFAIERSVFIIDSHNNISKEVDLAIFDEMYTPYIFKYRNVKFIPIEAVAVVVECKSLQPKEADLNSWNDHIESLRTSKDSLARTLREMSKGGVPTQTATRPIRILCSLDKKDHPRFDFVIQAQEEGKIIIKDNKKVDLASWTEYLNTPEDSVKQNIIEQLERITLKDYEVPGTSILTFNFQLNQLLMLINNPMLFPHQAYAKMFRELEE
ncbi:DUF6602 domain-containing protein [Listeria goaensis]|uniref:DUF6602 domain-containing protein n=1 Tax=Listeria goaensis TaxID=1649188 RepID=UPI000B590B09|nr:DUF6602 domain-containing protein [Listeria goaensis]